MFFDPPEVDVATQDQVEAHARQGLENMVNLARQEIPEGISLTESILTLSQPMILAASLDRDMLTVVITNLLGALTYAGRMEYRRREGLQ